ncbi:hypothetical protein SSCG_00249 [Streptomyces clavuligerus]|nr:hypothetical protein SSCG_00249 [Streptomyces clavuligerus]
MEGPERSVRGLFLRSPPFLFPRRAALLPTTPWRAIPTGHRAGRPVPVGEQHD